MKYKLCSVQTGTQGCLYTVVTARTVVIYAVGDVHHIYLTYGLLKDSFHKSDYVRVE
jgi:hypothetical protein